MNMWKCAESCMGSGVSCEIKLVHDNTPNKCMTNGEPVKWELQNTSHNSEYKSAPQATPKSCPHCNGRPTEKREGQGFCPYCDRYF